MKVGNLKHASAHVSLSGVQVKRGEFVSVHLVGAEETVHVELHVDEDGISRVLISEHNQKVVKTFEEVY